MLNAVCQYLSLNFENKKDPANIRPFIISDSNYGILANDLDFEKYYLFYKKYYQP